MQTTEFEDSASHFNPEFRLLQLLPTRFHRVAASTSAPAKLEEGLWIAGGGAEGGGAEGGGAVGGGVGGGGAEGGVAGAQKPDSNLNAKVGHGTIFERSIVSR